MTSNDVSNNRTIRRRSASRKHRMIHHLCIISLVSSFGNNNICLLPIGRTFVSSRLGGPFPPSRCPGVTHLGGPFLCILSLVSSFGNTNIFSLSSTTSTTEGIITECTLKLGLRPYTNHQAATSMHSPIFPDTLTAHRITAAGFT